MPLCPKCKAGKLKRIHRRPLERAISLLYPVYRFHCPNRECGWEGIFAQTNKSRDHLLKILIWPLIFLLIYIVVKKMVH